MYCHCQVRRKITFVKYVKKHNICSLSWLMFFSLKVWVHQKDGPKKFICIMWCGEVTKGEKWDLFLILLICYFSLENFLETEYFFTSGKCFSSFMEEISFMKYTAPSTGFLTVPGRGFHCFSWCSCQDRWMGTAIKLLCGSNNQSDFCVSVFWETPLYCWLLLLLRTGEGAG